MMNSMTAEPIWFEDGMKLHEKIETILSYRDNTYSQLDGCDVLAEVLKEGVKLHIDGVSKSRKIVLRSALDENKLRVVLDYCKGYNLANCI